MDCRSFAADDYSQSAVENADVALSLYFRWKVGDFIKFEVEQPRQVLVFIILEIIWGELKFEFEKRLRLSTVKLFRKRTGGKRVNEHRVAWIIQMN
jgi:hypothetical protein